MVFEDYVVDGTSCDTENSLRSAKEKVAKKLKKDFQDGAKGKTTVRLYIRIPLSSLYKEHPIDETAGVNQKIDKRIIDKIFELVSKGVTNIGEVMPSKPKRTTTRRQRRASRSKQFCLFDRKSGNSVCYKDMAQSWYSWMPCTKRQSMLFHCSSYA